LVLVSPVVAADALAAPVSVAAALVAPVSVACSSGISCCLRLRYYLALLTALVSVAKSYSIYCSSGSSICRSKLQ